MPQNMQSPKDFMPTAVALNRSGSVAHPPLPEHDCFRKDLWETGKTSSEGVAYPILVFCAMLW
jgi:hypothetical protein